MRRIVALLFVFIFLVSGCAFRARISEIKYRPQKYQGKQVYILAKGYQVGEALDKETKPLAYRSLLEKGVNLIPFTWIRSISGKSVITYNTFTFQEDKIEDIDTVVYAIGAMVNNQLYKSLKGKVKELYAIGDCFAPRRIQNAIYEGSKVGREL